LVKNFLQKKKAKNFCPSLFSYSALKSYINHLKIIIVDGKISKTKLKTDPSWGYTCGFDL